MAIRESKLGGDTDFVTALMVWMVKESRQQWLDRSRTYQHRSATIETVPFVSVYAEGEEGEDARGQVFFNDAIFPEDSLTFWIDQLIVIHDDGAHLQTGGASKRVAILIVRWPDWVFRNRDRVRRFRVTLQCDFADNGNRWTKPAIVKELGSYDSIEAETQRVLQEA